MQFHVIWREPHRRHLHRIVKEAKDVFGVDKSSVYKALRRFGCIFSADIREERRLQVAARIEQHFRQNPVILPVTSFGEHLALVNKTDFALSNC